MDQTFGTALATALFCPGMKSDLKNDIEDDEPQTPDPDRRDRRFSRLSLRYNDMLRSAVD